MVSRYISTYTNPEPRDTSSSASEYSTPVESSTASNTTGSGILDSTLDTLTQQTLTKQTAAIHDRNNYLNTIVLQRVTDSLIYNRLHLWTLILHAIVTPSHNSNHRSLHETVTGRQTSLTSANTAPMHTEREYVAPWYAGATTLPPSGQRKLKRTHPCWSWNFHSWKPHR